MDLRWRIGRDLRARRSLFASSECNSRLQRRSPDVCEPSRLSSVIVDPLSDYVEVGQAARDQVRFISGRCGPVAATGFATICWWFRDLGSLVSDLEDRRANGLARGFESTGATGGRAASGADRFVGCVSARSERYGIHCTVLTSLTSIHVTRFCEARRPTLPGRKRCANSFANVASRKQSYVFVRRASAQTE